MSLVPPLEVGGGGAPPRKPRKPRTGQYDKGPDGKLKNRCICCGLEGDAVPQQKGTNPTMLGLHMGGHLEPDQRKAAGDLRFAPWNDRKIEWAKKTETKKKNATKAGGKLDVTWPAGMGPMCYQCADMCRTLPCGALVPWRYLESARREWRLLGKAAPPFVYSCAAEDGSYVSSVRRRSFS
jgi:hypothetical protein